MAAKFNLKCWSIDRKQQMLASGLHILNCILGPLPELEDKEKNSFSIPILLLRLVSILMLNPQYLLYERRRDHNRRLLSSTRQADNLASNGWLFSAGNPNNIQCAACDTKLEVDQHSDSSLQQHKSSCHFNRLIDVTKLSHSLGLCKDDVQLINFLTTHILTTKFQVVVNEFAYDPDLVCELLVKKFVLQDTSNPLSAGELAADLFDIFEGANFQRNEVLMLAGCHEFLSSTPLSLGLEAISNLNLELSSSYPKVQAMETDGEQSTSLPVTRLEKERTRDRQALLKDTVKLLADSLCKSCWKNNAQCLIMPCAHLALCKNCSSTVEVCPICCQRRESVLLVYLP